jgi:hypothetical protein
VRIRERAVEGRIDEVTAALETLHGLTVADEGPVDGQAWHASA